MKKLFNLSLLSLLFVSIMSCSDDDTKTIVSEDAAPVLISPENGASVVLDPDLESNPALTLVWNHGAYTVPTEITYTVQMAVAGTEFETVVVGGTTTNRVFSLSVKELNTKALEAGLEPFEAADLDVRIMASLGANDALPMASNTVTITVTPYSIDDPQLFLIGNPQKYYGLSEWSPTTGMAMRYIGDGKTKVFEAYVKLAAGDALKFGAVQGEWSAVDAAGNYGLGDAAGVIKNGGGAGDIKPATTDGDGLYYIQVDIDKLTYKSVKMDWGIIGDATPGGWNEETAMTYDFAANKYTLTANLTANGLKYRSSNTGNFIYAGEDNSAWKFNVGNSDPKVTYSADAPNFTISAAGSHDLELTINFDGTAVTKGE